MLARHLKTCLAGSRDRRRAGVLAAAAVALLAPVPAAARVLEPVQTAEGSQLFGVERVVLSPDDRHLYAGGSSGINVFARKPVSGNLRFVERQESLREHFVLSSDGRHLYSTVSGVLTVFERDPRSGRLRRAGSPHFSFERARPIAISPDGRHLYAAGDGASVHVLERDAATGDLLEAGKLPRSEELKFARLLTVSPDGRHVYVTNLDQLAVLARHPESGALSLVEPRVDGVPEFDGVGTGLTSLAISPDGRHVYVTVFGLEEAIWTFERDPVGGNLSRVEAPFGAGSLTITAARSVVVDPSGVRVYLAAERADAVVAFVRDRASGVLSYLGAIVDGEGGADGLDHVKAVAVSPGGRDVYAAGAADGAVARLRGGIGTRLAFVEARFSDDDGVAGLGAAGDAVASPDGKHVYVGGVSQVTALARDGHTGALSHVMTSTETGLAPGTFYGVDLAMSPLGEHLYAVRGRILGLVASLTVFARDPIAGDVALVQAVDNRVPDFGRLLGASSVIVSPDGRHVYVGTNASVLALSRDGAAGTVDLVAVVGVGEAVMEALELAVSPDGRHLYVAEREGSRLGTFRRDQGSGTLELVGFDHLPEGLIRAGRVAVSPDGRHLYVAGNRDDAVSVFARDARTGRPSFVAAYFDGEGGLDGLAWPSDVAVDPGGEVVYLSSSQDHSVAVFARDPGSGRLSLLEVHRDERLGVRGLTLASSVSVSPDGRNVYLTSPLEGAVTVFRRQRGPCVDSPQTVCLAADRFRVEVEWLDFEGRQGAGRAVPHGSDDSGLLWFFDADNWELLVKVLDGCGINQRYWLYAAATTDVGYTLRITDTLTGAVRTYSNPLGRASPAVTDSDAFATCAAVRRAGASAASAKRRPTDPGVPPARSAAAGDASDGGSCREGLNRLCLDGGRFQAEVEWRDFAGRTGPGRALSFGAGDSGVFWFFDERNWELLVKVLDGCERNDRYWVFAAGTTDVHYRLRVTDTSTGVVREYENPLGIAAAAVTDNEAFATCP